MYAIILIVIICLAVSFVILFLFALCQALPEDQEEIPR